VKDESVIPKGLYCYTRIDGKHTRCPYWARLKDAKHQENGYCAFLEKSDWELNEEKYIKEYWLGDEHIQLDRAYSSHEMGFCDSLLWDECKECGINMDDDEDGIL